MIMALLSITDNLLSLIINDHGSIALSLHRSTQLITIIRRSINLSSCIHQIIIIHHH
jgi:hypothetical protein